MAGSIIGGAIGKAVGGFLGGKLGGSSGGSRKKQIEAQTGARAQLWHDAKYLAPQYGIHPLIALGNTPYVSTGGVGTGSNYSGLGADVGGDIGRAVGGRADTRAAKLRQVKVDALNLEKHKAELAVLHSEANKNNAVADQYLSSSRNRAAQVSNSRQDQNKIANIDPDNIPVTMEPAREQRVPKKGHWIKYLGADMYVPAGTTAETLEQFFGEFGGSIMGIPKIMEALGANTRIYSNNQMRRFKNYLERARYLRSQKKARPYHKIYKSSSRRQRRK